MSTVAQESGPKHSMAGRTALILETNNLRGGADMAQAADSLQRLIIRLAQQTLPPAAMAQWIITHDGFPAEVCAKIQALAGCHIDFVEINASTGYYDAKNAGFDHIDAQRCDYVVFGDADCLPANDWLEQLLAPFSRDEAAPSAVAGRTSYAPNVLGAALTSIDFMYFPSPLRQGATRNFYANNVAFKREVFEQYRYQALDGVYRAHCQVMGLRMQAAGVVIAYAPTAHTEHRLPDTRGETLKLRWMRGKDSVGLTPYLVKAYLPGSWQWLGRSGPIGPLCVMFMRLGYSLRALNRQDLPRLGALPYLAAAMVTVGISMVDMAGALMRGLGLAGRNAALGDTEALSYHRH
ncbi:glycosyltransferase family 2 protein [Comamonas sp. GB3 AK4-5]|uniref:glycosyltransferase n=1 Tax=Comamonas sp. GB3 AK4-5 TaxID=3231487 RepID=UPI00351EEA82